MPAGPTSDQLNAQDEIPTQIPITDLQPPTLPSTVLIRDRNGTSAVQGYGTPRLPSLPPDAQPSGTIYRGVRRRHRGIYREELVSSLSPENQRIIKDADPIHQPAIIEIFTSFDFNQRGNIPAEKLQVFYISVPHARSEGDKQRSRGGPAGYTCLWQACPRADKMIKRRDHMINHIKGHFGVKPFACTFGNGTNLPRCSARFLLADDLKRHVRRVHDIDSDFTIVRPYPKRELRSKPGIPDNAEPRRATGHHPSSTQPSNGVASPRPSQQPVQTNTALTLAERIRAGAAEVIK